MSRAPDRMDDRIDYAVPTQAAYENFAKSTVSVNS